MRPLEYVKALLASSVAGLASATGAAGDGAITLQEWLTVAGVTLGAFLAVWAIPNAEEPVSPPADQLSE